MRGGGKGKEVHSFTVSTTANFRAYNIAYKRGRDNDQILLTVYMYTFRKMEGEETCMNPYLVHFQLRKGGDCPYLDLKQLNL